MSARNFQGMLKADDALIKNLGLIEREGVNTSKIPNCKVRAHWEDGTPAYTKFITHVSETYDLSKGEFPFSELRPIAVKSGIKEILWIYQDQSNDLSVLKNKYNVHWWDEWDIGDGTIGQRYGATVRKYDQMNRLLDGLKNDPYGRRHIISLWQLDDLNNSPGLAPCAFETLWTVRGEYLDCHLTQRSNDIFPAGNINALQYAALLMMVAKATGYKPGKLTHYVDNYHYYDRHEWVRDELIKRYYELLRKRERFAVQGFNFVAPKLVLDTDNTDFYKFTIDDFKVVDYDPLPKLDRKIEIAI